MENNSLNKIQIVAQVKHLAEQSDEADNRFVFSYTITLTNNGDSTVQLLSRHWIITDGNNQVQEVRGQGVVGEQPVHQTGAEFWLHQRHGAIDTRRHHDGQLSDGG